MPGREGGRYRVIFITHSSCAAHPPKSTGLAWLPAMETFSSQLQVHIRVYTHIHILDVDSVFTLINIFLTFNLCYGDRKTRSIQKM